jgi:hypothetical protein
MFVCLFVCLCVCVYVLERCYFYFFSRNRLFLMNDLEGPLDHRANVKDILNGYSLLQVECVFFLFFRPNMPCKLWK